LYRYHEVERGKQNKAQEEKETNKVTLSFFFIQSVFPQTSVSDLRKDHMHLNQHTI